MMKGIFYKTRFILYILLLFVISWFLFNFLLTRQSSIMYSYFIEKPASYNLERAERLAASIYQSFKKEIQVPSLGNIKKFIDKYNEIPFLSVNFIYEDADGTMQSTAADPQEIDILSAEYVYPIKYGDREIGTLLVYDINKEYKKGLQEYRSMLDLTRIFFAVLLALLLGLMTYREYSAKIDQKKRIAEYQAIHDGLTGLYTHKHFKEQLEKEVSRAQRYKRPLSLVMCDIDFFKKFNDTYGHLMGDEILRTVSRIISDNIRTSDVVARYGGEEFAILLIETGHKEAQSVARRLKNLLDQSIEVAERIKGKVESAHIDLESKSVGVTLSMGLSSYDGREDYDPDFLIKEADHALYHSKNSGRNLITVFNPETKEFKSFK